MVAEPVHHQGLDLGLDLEEVIHHPPQPASLAGEGLDQGGQLVQGLTHILILRMSFKVDEKAILAVYRVRLPARQLEAISASYLLSVDA